MAARAGLQERLTPKSGGWRLRHLDSREARGRFLNLDSVGWSVYIHDREGAGHGMETRHPFRGGITCTVPDAC